MMLKILIIITLLGNFSMAFAQKPNMNKPIVAKPNNYSENQARHLFKIEIKKLKRTSSIGYLTIKAMKCWSAGVTEVEGFYPSFTRRLGLLETISLTVKKSYQCFSSEEQQGNCSKEINTNFEKQMRLVLNNRYSKVQKQILTSGECDQYYSILNLDKQRNIFFTKLKHKLLQDPRIGERKNNPSQSVNNSNQLKNVSIDQPVYEGTSNKALDY